jgi:hypothetical protein
MGPPRALSLAALRLKVRKLHAIFLTAIRAIFANQRFGGASVGMGEARSNPFIDPLCGLICGPIGGNSV